jgi:copper chaperone CopZ
MSTVTLSISGMSCGHCVASVRSALEAVPGVQVEQVRLGAAVVRVDEGVPDATSAALAAVSEAGYDATVGPANAAELAPALAPALAPLGVRRRGEITP